MTGFPAHTDWNRVLKQCAALLRKIPAPQQDRDDALADVVRDTLHSCAETNTFSGEQHLCMYLTRAARCKLIDSYRRRRRNGEQVEYNSFEDEAEFCQPTYSKGYLNPETSLDVQAALATLTPTQKQILTLSLEGYTAREIEEILRPSDTAANNSCNGYRDQTNELHSSPNNSGGGGSQAAAENKESVTQSAQRLRRLNQIVFHMCPNPA